VVLYRRFLNKRTVQVIDWITFSQPSNYGEPHDLAHVVFYPVRCFVFTLKLNLSYDFERNGGGDFSKREIADERKDVGGELVGYL
jgi:hypothetical protein